MKIQIKKNLFVAALSIAAVFSGCSEDDDLQAQKLSARFTQTINQNNGTVTFLNTSENATSYSWDFADGTNSTLINPIKQYAVGGSYLVVLEVSNNAGETARFEDVVIIPDLFNGGLLINGDFQDGSAPWIQGVDDNNPAPIVTENSNTFYQVDVTNPDPTRPFLVNLSQKLEIIQGNTYELTFDAWSDRNRDIIAGIGLSGGNFDNTVQTVNITTTQQEYQLTLDATTFGAPDARVLFDMNGAAGLVNIDNVTLNIQ